MKISYIIIPLIMAYVSYVGLKVSKEGLREWYSSLRKPHWSPNKKMVRELWSFLYLLITVSILLFWTVTQISVWHYFLAAILLYNFYLNITWNKTFFVEHSFAKSYKKMVYLAITAIAATIIMWPIYLLPALLFLPYVAWSLLSIKWIKETWTLNKN